MSTVPFTGNATIGSGNGTSLLANSTVKFANGTVIVNGNASVPFGAYLVINAGNDAGNVAHVVSGNASLANSIQFGYGAAGISGVPFNISPWQVMNSVNSVLGNLPSVAGITTADANLTFFAASAATYVTFEGA